MYAVSINVINDNANITFGQQLLYKNPVIQLHGASISSVLVV